MNDDKKDQPDTVNVYCFEAGKETRWSLDPIEFVSSIVTSNPLFTKTFIL